ncbi:MAG: hypothetical protein ACJ71P_15390 [Nitrososphaeraceae archaeon]|jgi:hypothetical protein
MDKSLSLETPTIQGFYVLPKNESDAVHLFQILSREEDIAVRWEENKFTNLFDNKKQRKLIYVQAKDIVREI